MVDFLNDGQLQDIGFAAVGRRMDVTARYKTGGDQRQAVRLGSGADAVVIKFQTDRDINNLSSTENNLRVLRGLGIPGPEVLGHQRVDTPDVTGEALVMSFIDGVELRDVIGSLDRPRLAAIADQIVAMERAAYTLPVGTGCGFAPIGMDPGRTWYDVLVNPNETFADPLPEDTRAIHERLIVVLESRRRKFKQLKPTCYLDDLTTKNVLINRKGELAGVVDFDVVGYGDPMFHLGLTGAAVRSIDQPVVAPMTYVEELERAYELTDEQRVRGDLYRALFLVKFLGAESPYRQGPWRELSVANASAALDNVERTMGAGFGL